MCDMNGEHIHIYDFIHISHRQSNQLSQINTYHYEYTYSTMDENSWLVQSTLTLESVRCDCPGLQCSHNNILSNLSSVSLSISFQIQCIVFFFFFILFHSCDIIIKLSWLIDFYFVSVQFSLRLFLLLPTYTVKSYWHVDSYLTAISNSPPKIRSTLEHLLWLFWIMLGKRWFILDEIWPHQKCRCPNEFCSFERLLHWFHGIQKRV